MMSTGLDAHTTGDLRHWRKQREPSARRRNRFVGDAGCTTGDKVLGLCSIGGEMQVGKQEMPWGEHRPFDRLGFLDLDDHLGGTKDLGSRRSDLRSDRFVVAVLGADAKTSPALHDHIVAVVG